MIQTKTHFEQIPLEIVRKILEQQTEKETMDVLPIKTREEKLKVTSADSVAVIR